MNIVRSALCHVRQNEVFLVCVDIAQQHKQPAASKHVNVHVWKTGLTCLVDIQSSNILQTYAQFSLLEDGCYMQVKTPQFRWIEQIMNMDVFFNIASPTLLSSAIASQLVTIDGALVTRTCTANHRKTN